MSAFGGEFNRSTQHSTLKGKDGVYGEGLAISSRFHSGREDEVVESLAQIRSKRSGEHLVSRHHPFVAK